MVVENKGVLPARDGAFDEMCSIADAGAASSCSAEKLRETSRRRTRKGKTRQMLPSQMTFQLGTV